MKGFFGILSAMLLIMGSAQFASALRGKVILINGDVLEGDVQNASDGSCWLTLKSGSIRFEKREIKKIVIKSKKDNVQQRFANSFCSSPQGTSREEEKNEKYESIINQSALHHQIDPALIKAVIKAESNFNPLDTSYKGACGLMQLMPGTAKILGVKDIYSPKENIYAGTRYLRDMLYLFDGNIEKALAAYNAGPHVVSKYNNSIPPYRETKSYIKRVGYYYRKYSRPGKICAFDDENGCLNIYNVR
jgi:hypothetical protein